MTKDQREPPLRYPADKARQGEIVLRKHWQRALFIAGLILVVVFDVMSGWAQR